MSQFSFTPQFDDETVRRRLCRLLVPGRIADGFLDRRVARLDASFRLYANTVSFGLWASGLAVTDEMRVATEVWLPLKEIRQGLDRLQLLCLTFSPLHPPPLLQRAETWLDLLPRLPADIAAVNPAAVLRRLMADGEERCRFLFALCLPTSYGGGFERYPGQSRFLRAWLTENRARLRRILCLDAACGSGEGTYELAELLLENGFTSDRIRIEGITIGELELFSAAHGFFPGDPLRQAAFRQRLLPLVACGATERMRFCREDLAAESISGGKRDIVLCNGLLGGPALHEPEILAGVVRNLAGRLAKGGVLLAADRFHEGWRKRVPKEMLEEMIRRSGLTVLQVPEGVGGRN